MRPAFVEDADDIFESGYFMAAESQHCAGYTIMQINQWGTSWPGIDNDEALLERLSAHVDLDSPVFASVEDFLAGEREHIAMGKETHEWH